MLFLQSRVIECVRLFLCHARLLLSLLAANEIHGAEFGIDIRDLIKLDDVTSRLHLGPNGGLVYVVPRLYLYVFSMPFSLTLLDILTWLS